MTRQILEILTGIRPEFDFSASQDFVTDGLLDSMDVVTLVSDLDKAFSICIDGVDILPENFRNLESIRHLLKKYGASS